ncbi:zeta toxin family protein [Streptacidiphilus anmyonensis]|uniref:zeta toxin family protein n=1 Tax=Streptacidiphilus anmyonensis TaxID=405782 RepID=UPI0005A7B448|nr:zeta toxin family protein [Streptacidiphilus anmyonensis]
MKAGDAFDELDPSEGARILAEELAPAVLAGAVPQRRPVAVFVAGQAGSGKTMVVDLVLAALAARGGAVRVDRDAYKTAHPGYDRLLAEDVRTAGVRVRADTYAWAARVEEQVRLRRFDAVVEAPLGRPEEFLDEVAAYRRAGYRVELVALAVPEALSVLGVLDRYLRLAKQGRPRFVGWDNHDACAAALPAVLEVVEAEGLADRVTVVRRSTDLALEAVYVNEVGADGCLVRPAGAAKAVLAERRRPWDAAQTGRFRRELAAADRRVNDPRLPEDWALAVRRDVERAAALAEPLRRTAQPLTRAPGVDYHRLNADEHEFVFEHVVAGMMLKQVVAQERPRVVYVAGQPGAGKTRAAFLVHRTLPDVVHLSGDHFKALHPDYWDLLTSGSRRASAAIRADYRAWQAKAEAYVRERRGTLLIETTPEDAASFVAGALTFRRAGYRVELLVLAVRAADSRQGTAHRYARVTKLGAPARFTTGAGHDAVFQVLPDVVAAAERLAVVDQVTVMRRDASALYRSDPTAEGSLRHAGAALALLAEQSRPYTDQEAAQFWAIQRHLHQVMPQYRDDLVDIAARAIALMPYARQPRRLDLYGRVAALPALCRAG